MILEILLFFAMGAASAMAAILIILDYCVIEEVRTIIRNEREDE